MMLILNLQFKFLKWIITWKLGTWSPIQQLEFSEEFTGLSFKRYQA